jgi:diadenosine tetraphosphate (Ap4A) HIT family hydrolase
MAEHQDCALCQPSAHLILWQDDFCRVVLLNDADYPAYCRVELKTHTKEMTDLTPADRARTMKVVFAAESALREVIQPAKINLASLGNKTPHIHWHIIPRFETDKHFPNSHWGKATQVGKPPALSLILLSQLKTKITAHITCALAE